jgi:hypothetical protein
MFAEVSNQMLELYEQNRTNGATGSLANDPSPSEMHRGHAPVSSIQAPSTNGNHQYQSTSENPQAMESAADEVSSKQVEDKASGTMRSLSPPSDRPLDARQKGTPEPLGASKIMNGRIKQETTVKNKVLRTNGEKFEHHLEYREEVKFSATQVGRNGDGDSAA